ncbi:hypothetical protein EV360DRAFT_71033 [Lentinula raphanica]|nr:hypothetical protein EV360DRAFT_71033 [Lentinula raphanica]
MDKYSRVAWHTNPNASASLTDTERQLARKLFANTEVAWNHTALQECLRRHITRMAKMDRQSSNMNTMTLFSVIWKYECPGSCNSHSVWTAMRAELDGVLTELVSCFHIYTKGEYGTGESSSRVRTSGGSKDNQEQSRARGTTDPVELGLRQTQYSANFASTTVPVSEHVADSGPAVSNQFFTSSPEPNLQLHFLYAEPAAGFHSNVGISRLAAPEVCNPISEQSLASQSFIQNFGPGAQRNAVPSDLASASYAAMSHALRLDPFAPQDGSHGYQTGPDIWQGERQYPPQWTHYQTENGASSFDPSMGSHTIERGQRKTKAWAPLRDMRRMTVIGLFCQNIREEPIIGSQSLCDDRSGQEREESSNALVASSNRPDFEAPTMFGIVENAGDDPGRQKLSMIAIVAEKSEKVSTI